MSRVRRASALTLVVTLSLIGIPFPVSAAEGESPPLTINGQPLSQFLNRTAPGDLFPEAGFLARPEQSPSEIGYGEVQVGQPNLSRRAKVWLAVGIAVGVVLAATIALGCYDADGCAG